MKITLTIICAALLIGCTSSKEKQKEIDKLTDSILMAQSDSFGMIPDMRHNERMNAESEGRQINYDSAYAANGLFQSEALHIKSLKKKLREGYNVEFDDVLAKRNIAIEKLKKE